MGLLDSIGRALLSRPAPKPAVARKLGLALGGGSVRGWAHIGVLKVLEREHIVPDIVTGTSMGAIIGAAWCSGMSAADLEDLVVDFDLRKTRHLFGNLRHLRPGLVRSDALKEFLRPHLKATFEELDIPFACVSCDLRTGDRIVTTEGNLLEAVYGSASIPLLFEPVETDLMLVADGGMVEPVPVFAARELGATDVIAVSLTMVYPRDVLKANGGGSEPHRKRLGASSKLQMALNSTDVMAVALAGFAREEADLFIVPDVRGYAQFAFDSGRELVDAGEAAAREHLDELRAIGGNASMYQPSSGESPRRAATSR